VASASTRAGASPWGSSTERLVHAGLGGGPHGGGQEKLVEGGEVHGPPGHRSAASGDDHARGQSAAEVVDDGLVDALPRDHHGDAWRVGREPLRQGDRSRPAVPATSLLE
jgi:hypothetical protein